MKVPFGKRATIYPGTADIEGILQDEVAGKYIQRLQVASEKRGKILVMGREIHAAPWGEAELILVVSATGHLRDELRALVRPHLDHGVRLQELEFQPE